MSDADVSVAVDVRRAPDVVWAAIADPTRFPSWSPEAAGVLGAAASGGPLAVGAQFSGANRNGIFRWSTRCTVVESVAGTTFAFDVTYLGMAVARWRYAVTPSDTGSRVEEQWWDHRGAIMKAIGAIGTGVADRRTHNERTMRATLDALKAELEDS